MTTPGYYSILTARVRYAPITSSAKLLYSELTALSQIEGYCYAGNAYFAELYSVEERQVRRWLNELTLLSVIRIEFHNGQRRIYILDDPGAAGAVKKDRGAVLNDRGGRSKKTGKAVKKDRHNNINNTTSINNVRGGTKKGAAAGDPVADFMHRVACIVTPQTATNIRKAQLGNSLTFRGEDLTELASAIVQSLGGEVVFQSAEMRHKTGKGGTV